MQLCENTRYGARQKQVTAALQSWPAWNDSKMLPCKPPDLDKHFTAPKKLSLLDDYPIRPSFIYSTAYSRPKKQSCN